MAGKKQVGGRRGVSIRDHYDGPSHAITLCFFLSIFKPSTTTTGSLRCVVYCWVILFPLLMSHMEPYAEVRALTTATTVGVCVCVRLCGQRLYHPRCVAFKCFAVRRLLHFVIGKNWCIHARETPLLRCGLLCSKATPAFAGRLLWWAAVVVGL